jgi:hypothetical protein
MSKGFDELSRSELSDQDALYRDCLELLRKIARDKKRGVPALRGAKIALIHCLNEFQRLDEEIKT